jgi:O-antigen/teichoic acid export membrane protein
MARIAAGERRLMPQAVRVMIAATIAVNALLALTTPVLLSLVFGPAFRDAFPMVLILLVAQVSLAAVTVLSSALHADGAPLIPTAGELIALLITVSGLIALLAPLGGVGAAIVSLAAYGASFLFQVVKARSRTGIAIREFLVPSRADLDWARGRFGDVTRSLGFSQ